MEEEENFLKVFKLVTGPGTECVRQIFDTLLPPATLNVTLNLHKNTTIDDLKRKRRITVAQDALLFPPTGGGASSVTFDLSLMICLIRNLTSTAPPINGWDTLPQCTETSMGADIARIKCVRNLLAHTNRNVMTSSDFNIHWSSLYDALHRQGGPSLKMACDAIKQLRLVSDIEIKDFVRQVEDFRLEILQEFNDFREEIKDMKEKVVDHQTELEEVNKNVTGLQTDMKELKKQDSKQSVIPIHIQDQFKRRIDKWRKEDEKFVVTAGSKHVMTCLNQNSCVSVIGNSGTGKTFAARHTALEMEKKGYIIIPLSEPKDLDFFEHDHETLFVIDDLCGKFTLNKRYLDDWKLALEKIESFLKDKCCKIIATCRLQVYQDRQFNLQVFKECTCNLSSLANSLTPNEIKGFVDAYLKDKGNELPELTKDIDFYPLLFSLYHKTKNIKDFFSKPFDCYTKELDALEDEGPRGKRKYCGLVLCVLFNNTLTENDLLGETSHRKTAIDKVLLNCGTETKPRKLICKDLEALKDIYIRIEDDTFQIIHDKLFDFLAMYFGNKMTAIFIKYAQLNFFQDRFLFNDLITMPAEIRNFIRLNDAVLPIHIDFIHVKEEIQLQVEGHVICCIPLINNGRHLIGRVKYYQEKGELKCILEGKGLNFIQLSSKYVPMYFDRLIDIWREGEVSRVFSNLNISVSATFKDSFYNHLKGMLTCDLDKLVAKQDNTSSATALHYLSDAGYIKGVKWLLSFSSVNINQTDKTGLSPLQYACGGYLYFEEMYGNEMLNLLKSFSIEHLEVVRLLLQHKAVDICNDKGETSLFLACYKGNLDVVRLLLEHPIEINKQRTDGRTPLHTACYNNHVEVVKELLKKDQIDVDVCDIEGMTSLYYACDRGNADVVRLLLEHPIEINKQRTDGWTPLHTACYNNHVEVVKELLKSNHIDVHICNDKGETSLFLACYSGNVDVVRLLLEHPVEINKHRTDGWTPLHAACYNNHVEVVKELLKSDHIDVDICTDKGETSLFLACYSGNVDVVRLLLEHPIEINKHRTDGWTPLHAACYNNHVEVVKELLKKDQIDVDVCDIEGMTSLFYACDRGNADVVRLLLEHPIEINKQRTDGWTPLHTACYNNHVEVVKELLKSNHIDVHICNDKGETSLFLACYSGNVDVVRLLLEHPIEINKQITNGWTPLHTACYNNHVEVVKELLKSDHIDVHIYNDKDETSLFLACYSGNVDMVRLLLEHPIEINKQRTDGWTPLHAACYNNHVEIIQELLKKDQIDVDVCDIKGMTSLFYACDRGNADVVRLLLEHPIEINKHRTDGLTPLHAACYTNYVEVVKELLKKDQIDVDVCDIEGMTSLYYACDRGNADVVRLLLEHPIEINKQRTDGWTPLHTACYNNHVEVVKELLKSNHIDVHICNDKGETSLFLACYSGNVDVVRLLLEHPIEINKQITNGWTPLHTACYNNHVEVVKELLKSDHIDVHIYNDKDETSLFLACYSGNVDMVRLLLEHPIEINKQRTDGWTPLHAACYNNHVEIIQELLKKDQIDVDVCDIKGMTSLFYACDRGNADVVRLLLEHPIEINKHRTDGLTPLHAACYTNYVEVVKELLKKDQIDVDVCDIEGMTSLFYACDRGNADVVRLLLQHSASLKKSDTNGWTPLHAACYSNHVQVVKELLESDQIDLNVCTNRGDTSLYLASEVGNVNVVRLLLLSSANVNKANVEGFTPLIIACQRMYATIVHELLKCQADVNAYMYDGDNALISASRNGSTELVHLLLQNGSNPNACMHTKSSINIFTRRTQEVESKVWYKDLSSKLSADLVEYLQTKPIMFAFETAAGSSSLHFASLLGYVAVAKLLIQHKADVNMAKEDGTTPLFYACEFGKVEVVKLLLNEGANTAMSKTDGVTPLGIAINNGYFVVVYFLMKHNQNSFDN